ncbi:MAG: DnaD domain protein [Chloroflexota bacterium]|nr:DnaD domain protein [Chloroflexota bacterium]
MTEPERAAAWRQFSGFPEGKAALVQLPDLLFTDLIPIINDLLELQVTLLILWRLARRRAQVAPWVTRAELLADAAVQQALGSGGEAALDGALARAVARGTLLAAEHARAAGVERRYLANGPQGRMVAAAWRRGVEPAQAEVPARPNIYTLYEQNVGPLTALLSEDLQEAEKTYPAAWIEDAFREAVRLNKRSWKYIRAILERWQTEGRDEISRRAGEEDGRRYIEGEYADFIQH